MVIQRAVIEKHYPDLLAALDRLADTPSAAGTLFDGLVPDPEKRPGVHEAMNSSIRAFKSSLFDLLNASEVEGVEGEIKLNRNLDIALGLAFGTVLIMGTWLGQQGLARIPNLSTGQTAVGPGSGPLLDPLPALIDDLRALRREYQANGWKTDDPLFTTPFMAVWKRLADIDTAQGYVEPINGDTT